MDFDQLLTLWDFENIEVTVINPVRKDEVYKKGRLTGFKSGLYGGGHSRYKNGMPHEYSSLKRRWIKPPKVHVTYSIFDFGGKEHSDWIDVDNCIFEIKKEEIIPPKKSRCCGRCDGINDLCFADMYCDDHKQLGCRVCWPDPE